MKNVLYHYPYQQVDTGSPKVLLEMIASLDRNRFTPVFIGDGDGDLSRELAARGIEVIDRNLGPLDLKRPLDALARLWRLVRLLRRRRIDLVHINAYPWRQDLILAAWLARVPVVTHIHNRTQVPALDFGRLFADRVFIVSETQKEAVEGLDRIAGKVRVLYNSIDTSTYAGGTSIRQSLGYGDDDLVVVTVAQIQPIKGIDILLDTAVRAHARDNRLRFLVVGPDGKGKGEADFARTLRERVAREGMDGAVTFLGSRSDVPDLLASSDLFLLCSRSEAFGLVVVEAMAAGLPVVASRVGGIREILATPDLGITVDPPTAEGFDRALAEVLSRPDRGRAMGARGRESLRERFSREVIGARLQRHYRDLAG